MKKAIFTLFLLLFICPAHASSQAEMDKYISSLMKKMTVREKLGQLNLLPGGDVTPVELWTQS